MKTIELQIPEGKKAEWINGVLTLVDEEVKDNRQVTELVKTFEDACRELGESHPLVNEYKMLTNSACFDNVPLSKDLLAYLKLRIIAAALNEGWQPQFTTDEYRYFPYFYLYTQEEIDKMDEETKNRVVYRSSSDAGAHGGVAYASTGSDSSYTDSYVGSRLAFKTRELAKYAGEQFAEIWADYGFK